MRQRRQNRLASRRARTHGKATCGGASGAHPILPATPSRGSLQTLRNWRSAACKSTKMLGRGTRRLVAGKSAEDYRIKHCVAGGNNVLGSAVVKLREAPETPEKRRISAISAPRGYATIRVRVVDQLSERATPGMHGDGDGLALRRQPEATCLGVPLPAPRQNPHHGARRVSNRLAVRSARQGH